jgi:hypothetical protein
MDREHVKGLGDKTTGSIKETAGKIILTRSSRGTLRPFLLLEENTSWC